MKIWIFRVFRFILTYVIIATIVNMILMGRLSVRLTKRCNVKKYFIKKANRIDIQKGLDCSGYASAYLLRYYDIPATGVELYQKMPCKCRDGAYIKGVCKLLSTYGFKVKSCAGTLNSLKSEVCKGHPVLVMIKVRPDKNWLHFVPVVGFDEEYLYIAESLNECVNCDQTLYNRKITIAEFKKLWNTSMIKMPFYRNAFVEVKR